MHKHLTDVEIERFLDSSDESEEDRELIQQSDECPVCRKRVHEFVLQFTSAVVGALERAA